MLTKNQHHTHVSSTTTVHKEKIATPFLKTKLTLDDVKPSDIELQRPTVGSINVTPFRLSNSSKNEGYEYDNLLLLGATVMILLIYL